MSFVGDLLGDSGDLFADFFGEPIVVRNYVEGETDEYGDTQRVPDSEAETDGQVEVPDDPSEVSAASGQTTTTDADILIPDSVFVTDGTDEHPYPSTIERVADGTIYTVVEVIPEGNGVQMVSAVSSEHE